MTTSWALVTGASAGLGKQFALQLAAKGQAVLLVARREAQLKELQSHIKAAHQVECEYLALDLSEPDANQTLFDHSQQNNWQIDTLINNAGYGVPGDFDAVDWQTHQDMLQVMLTSVIELCHLYYPLMKQRQQGQIINVSSLAGLTPATAGHTLYGAVKAFLVKFSQSLHLEASDHGVHVTALCPGFTYTEFHDVNGTRKMVSTMSKKLWMSAEDVVSQGLQAVNDNQAVYINGWRNRLIARLCKLLPESLVRYLMKGSIAKFRKR
ncbi:SDR family NAD(P)-dependent oxidoreductase [Marinicella sediminis]|uniref:SDR family NAD(P)-dependent oxidoreductase n=1 Tax=Marinicella sediminis TaxID=1792834 RepID=A0ABV7J5K8_9GAMM|nr:SDR family oxidoreductase [Marinicella sediminis]